MPCNYKLQITFISERYTWTKTKRWLV